MPYGNNGYGGNFGGRGNYGGPRNSTPRTSNFGPTCSTTGVRLENPYAGRFMDLNYFGKTMSIAIGAVQPNTPMDWQSTQNAQRVQVNITYGDMSELQDICEDVIDSVKTTGTFASIGCRVGNKQDSIVEISNGTNLNMAPGIYLVIYKNLDSSNRTNVLEFYPFRVSKVIKGYDHTSGQYSEEPMKLGEFKKFYKTVKEACKAFTMAQAHTIAHVNYKDKISAFKAMAAMTAALGIDMQKELDIIAKGQSKGSGRQGGGGQRNYGGGNNYPQQNRYQNPRSSAFEQQPNNFTGGPQNSMPVVTTTVDDPVDISLPIDQLANVDMADFS